MSESRCRVLVMAALLKELQIKSVIPAESREKQFIIFSYCYWTPAFAGVTDTDLINEFLRNSRA